MTGQDARVIPLPSATPAPGPATPWVIIRAEARRYAARCRAGLPPESGWTPRRWAEVLAALGPGPS